MGKTDHPKLVLDLEMDFDTQAAGEQDDMSLALDYAAVSKRVTDMISTPPDWLG